MQKFIVTKSCYIKQAGQAEPAYVEAAPDRPATVVLDDDTVPASYMLKHGERLPELKPAHAGAGKGSVQNADDFARGSRKGRAADM